MTLEKQKNKSVRVLTNAGQISELVAELKNRGYDLEFRREATFLYCSDLNYQITTDSFIVDEYYHFEDISNTDRDRILYAISTTQGVKGYLVDASFVYEDNISPEMAQKLKLE